MYFRKIAILLYAFTRKIETEEIKPQIEEQSNRVVATVAGALNSFCLPGNYSKELSYSVSPGTMDLSGYSRNCDPALLCDFFSDEGLFVERTIQLQFQLIASIFWIIGMLMIEQENEETQYDTLFSNSSKKTF